MPTWLFSWKEMGACTGHRSDLFRNLRLCDRLLRRQRQIKNAAEDKRNDKRAISELRIPSREPAGIHCLIIEWHGEHQRRHPAYKSGVDRAMARAAVRETAEQRDGDPRHDPVADQE